MAAWIPVTVVPTPWRPWRSPRPSPSCPASSGTDRREHQQDRPRPSPGALRRGRHGQHLIVSVAAPPRPSRPGQAGPRHRSFTVADPLGSVHHPHRVKRDRGRPAVPGTGRIEAGCRCACDEPRRVTVTRCAGVRGGPGRRGDGDLPPVRAPVTGPVGRPRRGWAARSLFGAQIEPAAHSRTGGAGGSGCARASTRAGLARTRGGLGPTDSGAGAAPPWHRPRSLPAGRPADHLELAQVVDRLDLSALQRVLSAQRLLMPRTARQRGSADVRDLGCGRGVG